MARWVQWSVIAVPLALVLIPALWGFVPSEIARWHDAAAKEMYLEGDLPGAIAELGVALAKDDRSYKRFELRARYRHDQEDFAGSLEDWEAAIRLAPESRNLLVQRSATLQHLGRHQEAIEDLKSVIKIDAQNRANLSYWERALDGANGGQSRVTELNNLAYARGVGNLELDDALADAHEVIKLLGGDAFMFEQTGYLHVLRKDWKRAKARLQEAAKAFEDEIDDVKKLAEQAGDKGAKENAPALVRKSEDRLAGVQFHLARVCRELNEADEAAKYEKRAAAWGKSEKNLRDRLPSLRVSWAYASQVAAYVDTRGYVLYQKGDYISARRDLELAVELVELDFERKDEHFEERRQVINDIREYRKLEKLERKGTAVVVYHRALVYQKLGLTDLDAEDLRRVKEVYGATPGDDLF